LQEVVSSLEFPGRAQAARASRSVASDTAQKPNPERTPPPPPKLARRRIAFRLVAAALLVALTIGVFTSDTTRIRQLTNAVPEIDSAISFVGFGLDQVSVKGHRFTIASDILDALELEQARSIFSFDADSARARIEDLSWVASVDFRRVYPNQLEITVRERGAFAVWRMGKTVSLIDKEGRVLSRIEENAIPSELPLFSRAGAATHAAAFWTDLNGHPAIKEKIVGAERFGKRRWSIMLANGVLIHLPESGVSTALTQLESWPGFDRYLANGDIIIDLRAKGRIVVRPTQAISRTSSGVRSIADLLDQSG
jgi:cell division protein FtsQ